jgi:hypothetical protein
VSAATAILDRAHGKPPSAPEDNEALKQANPLAGLTPGEILKLAKGETL